MRKLSDWKVTQQTRRRSGNANERHVVDPKAVEAYDVLVANCFIIDYPPPCDDYVRILAVRSGHASAYAKTKLTVN